MRMNLLIPSVMLLATFCMTDTLAFSQPESGSPQVVPATPGETINGKPVVLAQALAGHPAILIMGFTKEAGNLCTYWARNLHSDPVLTGIPIYEAAMLAAAPGFVRGMIKSSIRKGLSPSEQESFVVLSKDEQAWKSYFGVTDDKVPYVVLLDAQGKIRWQGHGAAKDLEPQLRTAAH